MTDYIWPLSKSTTPDEMNTSFGSRIDGNKWDFHDGIDLPAPIGTKVYAMRQGTIHRAGPGVPEKTLNGFHSRHVILKVDDPSGVVIYLVYLHLHSIAEGITAGASVTQGQLLGTVGEDDATYPHLHMEFRKSNPSERSSVHPLGYLPYTDMPNFSAPVLDRFNRLNTLMAARLRFSASCKLEGDLQRVEVDLISGATLLETRFVDFNDKETINEGNDDGKLFKNDIGVEGYQKSDLIKDARDDLQYGILIRNIPSECDTLLARVIEVRGNIATSAPIPVPNQHMTNENVDFEDGAMPPVGWTKLISTSGAGTTVVNAQCPGQQGCSDHPGSGSRVMCSIDESTTKSRQRAGIEFVLPMRRFEWHAEGLFNPFILNIESGQAIELLYFRSSDANLSVSARIFQDGDRLRAGIIVKNPDGTLSPLNSRAILEKNKWRKWKLHLLRIGTRETTAVLFLDNQEELRVNWDSTAYEPQALRAGIGLSSAGATAEILMDDLRLTESR